jgi:hypothetical protein
VVMLCSLCDLVARLGQVSDDGGEDQGKRRVVVEHRHHTGTS